MKIIYLLISIPLISIITYMANIITLNVVTAFATIILAIITCYYAYLVKRSNKLLEKQIEITSNPYISCSIEEDEPPQITIYVNGKYPAYGVEVIAFAQYFENENNLKTFIGKFVPNNNNFELTSDKERMYYVKDEFKHLFLPAESKAIADLNFPQFPMYVHILLKYRDVFGCNYISCHQFKVNSENNKRIYCCIKHFKSDKLSNKIKLDTKYGIVFEDGKPIKKIPDDIKDVFKIIYKHSVSAESLILPNKNIEKIDRGYIQNIKDC